MDSARPRLARRARRPMLEAGPAQAVTKSAHVRMPSAHASGHAWGPVMPRDRGSAFALGACDGVRRRPTESRGRAMESDGRRGRQGNIGNRRGPSTAVAGGPDREVDLAVHLAVHRAVDRHRWSSIERRWASIPCSRMAKRCVGASLDRRSRTMRDDARGDVDARCAPRGRDGCRRPSMRASTVSRRRCRAAPRCASMTSSRAPSRAPATRATDLQCMPQSLVACGSPASMRVLPRVFAAASRGPAMGGCGRRRKVCAQRSRTASSACRWSRDAIEREGLAACRRGMRCVSRQRVARVIASMCSSSPCARIRWHDFLELFS